MRRAKAADMAGPHLTDRQRKVLQVIEDSTQARGYPPTMREIGTVLGWRARRVSLISYRRWRRRDT